MKREEIKSQPQKYKDLLDIQKPPLHHKSMDVTQRAKQFAPFAALKGLEEAIRRAQEEWEDSVR